MKENKKAFTLAEVLITLTILGVLAAILIPALVNITPDANKVMFKKAYSIMEQTIEALINNDNYYPAADTGIPTGDTATVSKGLASTAGTIPPSSASRLCYFFSEQVNTIGTVNCTVAATSTTPSFITADGVVWYFTQLTPLFSAAADDGTGSSYAKVVVDVNGNKKPNCGAIIQSTYAYDNACGNSTQDRYMFGVRYDGKIAVFKDAAGKDIGQSILLAPTNNRK